MRGGEEHSGLTSPLCVLAGVLCYRGLAGWGNPFFSLLKNALSVHPYLSPSHILFPNTTFSDGCLGSNNDEGRSEV